jgi:hypothetical protein
METAKPNQLNNYRDWLIARQIKKWRADKKLISDQTENLQGRAGREHVLYFLFMMMISGQKSN